MVHSGEPVEARFAAFAEALVTVQPAAPAATVRPADPAAEVFVLAPIVWAPTVMAQLEVKDLWPRSGLPRSGPSQRPGEELSSWFLCGYFACHSFKRWTVQRMEPELPRHRQTEMRGAANEVAAT